MLLTLSYRAQRRMVEAFVNPEEVHVESRSSPGILVRCRLRAGHDPPEAPWRLWTQPGILRAVQSGRVSVRRGEQAPVPAAPRSLRRGNQGRRGRARSARRGRGRKLLTLASPVTDRARPASSYYFFVAP